MTTACARPAAPSGTRRGSGRTPRSSNRGSLTSSDPVEGTGASGTRDEAELRGPIRRTLTIEIRCRAVQASSKNAVTRSNEQDPGLGNERGRSRPSARTSYRDVHGRLVPGPSREASRNRGSVPSAARINGSYPDRNDWRAIGGNFSEGKLALTAVVRCVPEDEVDTSFAEHVSRTSSRELAPAAATSLVTAGNATLMTGGRLLASDRNGSRPTLTLAAVTYISGNAPDVRRRPATTRRARTPTSSSAARPGRRPRLPAALGRAGVGQLVAGSSTPSPASSVWRRRSWSSARRFHARRHQRPDPAAVCRRRAVAGVGQRLDRGHRAPSQGPPGELPRAARLSARPPRADRAVVADEVKRGKPVLLAHSREQVGRQRVLERDGADASRRGPASGSSAEDRAAHAAVAVEEERASRLPQSAWRRSA